MFSLCFLYLCFTHNTIEREEGIKLRRDMQLEISLSFIMSVSDYLVHRRCIKKTNGLLMGLSLFRRLISIDSLDILSGCSTGIIFL